MACSTRSRQTRVCGMPLAGSSFVIKIQRRQPAVRPHFRKSSMRIYTCLGAYSRRAGAAGSGSPGPGRTTGTATSKAGAGLAQRVARTASIASRFHRSALGTLCTALHLTTRSLNETKWMGAHHRLPTHTPVSHLASATTPKSCNRVLRQSTSSPNSSCSSRLAVDAYEIL